MRKKNVFSRFAKRGMALLMLLCLLGTAGAPVLAKTVTQADIDALKKNANSLSDQRKQLEKQLDDLADEIADVLITIEQLKLIYDLGDAVDDHMAMKIQRLQDRLGMLEVGHEKT